MVGIKKMSSKSSVVSSKQNGIQEELQLRAFMREETQLLDLLCLSQPFGTGKRLRVQSIPICVEHNLIKSLWENSPKFPLCGIKLICAPNGHCLPCSLLRLEAKMKTWLKTIIHHKKRMTRLCAAYSATFHLF